MIKFATVTFTTLALSSIYETRKAKAEGNLPLYDQDEKIYDTLEEAIADAKSRETGWHWISSPEEPLVEKVHTEVIEVEIHEDGGMREKGIVELFFDPNNQFGDVPVED